MDNSKSPTSVTKLKPVDPNDWLRIVTSDRERHQRMATPRGRLSWLFELADRSSRDTEPGQACVMPEDRDQDRLSCEVSLFLFMTGSGRLAPAAYYAILDAHEELMRQTIGDLSTQLNKGVDAFVDAKGAWDIQIKQATRTLTRVISSDSDGDRINAFNWWDSENWTTAFLLAAADAIMAEARNLRRCVACAKVFVVDDPRERFHNKQCASKYRIANWRARPAKPTKPTKSPARPTKSTKRKVS